MGSRNPLVRLASLAALAVLGPGLQASIATAQPAVGPDSAGDNDPVLAQYREARRLWRDDHLTEAASILESIVGDHLDHPRAADATNLLLDSLARLGEYDRMAEWITRLLAEESFLRQNPQLAERLALMKRQLLRKRAEELTAAKKYSECGRAFLDIHRQYPRQPRSDELLYNAGVCFSRASSIGAAITAFEALFREHPRSRLASRSILRLAELHRQIAHYGRAAREYSKYAKLYAGERDAPQVLMEAIFLSRALGRRR